MTPVAKSEAIGKHDTAAVFALQQGTFLGRVVSNMLPLFREEEVERIVRVYLEKLTSRMLPSSIHMVQRAIEEQQEGQRVFFIINAQQVMDSVDSPESRAYGVRVYGLLPVEVRRQDNVKKAVKELFAWLGSSSEQAWAILRTIHHLDKHYLPFLLAARQVAVSPPSPEGRIAAIDTLGLFFGEKMHEQQHLICAILSLFCRVEGKECRRLFKMIQNASGDRTQNLLNCQKIVEALSCPPARVGAIEVFLCLLSVTDREQKGIVEAVIALFRAVELPLQANLFLREVSRQREGERAGFLLRLREDSTFYRARAS